MADNRFACPHCGELLPHDAKFCRHCGASDDFGWDNEDPWSETHPGDDDAGYGEDDFDYDEFVAREFPDQVEHPTQATRGNGMLLIMVLVCVGILLTAILAAMSGRW